MNNIIEIVTCIDMQEIFNIQECWKKKIYIQEVVPYYSQLLMWLNMNK